MLSQAAHSKEIKPIKPSLTSHKWLSLRIQCQHSAIAPVKLADGHLNAQLQPFIEATPLARLTAFFKGSNKQNNGVNFIRLNQGRGWIGGFKQPDTAYAGLDGPDLILFSETLFAVYCPSGG